MEAIWQWGINLIMAIQQVHGPVLDSIFRGITFPGEEQFYLLLLPLILWCFDYSFGATLAVFFPLSRSLNVMVTIEREMRPFNPLKFIIGSPLAATPPERRPGEAGMLFKYLP